MFVFAATHPASPESRAISPSGPPASGVAPSTSAHLLHLVQILIAFGRRLAETLANHPGAQTLLGFTRAFGTRDLGLILARIIRGLRLAEALEQRLQRNARQIDNPRFRFATPRAPSRPIQAPCEEGPRNEHAQTPPAPEDGWQDIQAHLPTVEEIARQIRHRPIGAVLADICRDLGISPSHPAWGKLFLAIAVHRGNVVRLLEDMAPRLGRPGPPEATPHAPRTDAPAPTPPSPTPPSPTPPSPTPPSPTPFSPTPLNGPPSNPIPLSPIPATGPP